MPSVQGAVTKPTNIETQPQTGLITKDEVNAAIVLVFREAKASKKARGLQKEKEAALSVVFEKLLGIKTFDEVRLMNPTALAILMAEREKAGLFKLEEDNFDVKTPRNQVRPDYKGLLYQAVGEAKAIELAAPTPRKYSWIVVPKNGVMPEMPEEDEDV